MRAGWIAISLCLAGPAIGAAPDLNRKDFDFVVHKVEANYAGYPTKVTESTRAELAALTERQRSVAADAATDADFSRAVADWLAFFKDRHIWLEANEAAAPQPPGAPAEKAELTEEQARKKLDELGASRMPVEGIWESAGGRYTMALVRRDDSKELLGVIVSATVPGWSAGDVKAEMRLDGERAIKGAFVMGDRSKREVNASLRGPESQVLVFNFGIGPWVRIYPPTVNPISPSKVFESIGAPAPKMEKLSEKTMYLRLPDLYPSSKEKVDELLKTNKDNIDSCENLIIDLRDNPGGWDSVFSPLMPLIYSRPIASFAHEHRSTPDNIAACEVLAKAPDLTEDDRQWLLHVGEAMRATPGEFVVIGGRSATVEVFPTVLKNPARVAILIEGAASSAEQFIIAAQQSRKVTLFGRGNSQGVVDFGNVRDLALPSGRFTLRYATSRSARLPEYQIDGVGIGPDIVIPPEAGDDVAFVKEWVEGQATG